MVIHFSILAVILFVSLFFEQKNKQYALSCVDRGESFVTQSLPWILVFGYIAFLAAMRTNANDSSLYIYSFNNLDDTWTAFWQQLSSAKDKQDWAFDAVSILFKIIVSDNFHLWLALYAVIETVAFISILRKNAVSIFDCCFFFFCSTLYYNYFSMMRQWFAVVIIFWASRYIEEKKFIKFLMICLVVAQFHSSAYIMIIVYFLVQGKPWSGKQMALIAAAVLAMFLMNPILDSLESSADDMTYGYVISTMNSGSGSSVIRAFIAAVPVVLAFLYRKEIDNPMINVCVNMSILNLLLNILASFTSGLYIVRFSAYTNVYNMILYPYLLNVSVKGKYRIFIKVMFYAIYFAFYVYQMNYQGAFRYGSDILGQFY